MVYEIIYVQQEDTKVCLWVQNQLLDVGAAFLFLNVFLRRGLWSDFLGDLEFHKETNT